MKDMYTSTAVALLFGLGVAVSAPSADAAGQQAAGEQQVEQQQPAAGQAEQPAAAETQPPTAAETQQPTAGEVAGAEEHIPPEEAATRAEQRFEDLAMGEEELTEDQLAEALPGVDDVSELFQEIDQDGDGVVSREEWRQWSEQAFAEAAGPEGLTTEQYDAWERTGRFDDEGMEGMTEEPAQQ